MNYDIDEPVPYRILSPVEYNWVTYGTQPNGPAEPDEWDELGDVSDGPFHFGGDE